VRVTVVGDPSARGKLVTFHDIGLNHRSCFTRFFQMRRGEKRDKKVWEQFVIYHIDAPGHEEEAQDIDQDSIQMEDLVGVVESVVDHFKMGCFVGFGVGAGANVLLRFAVKKPEFVQALMLVGANIKSASESEQWYYGSVLKIMEWYGMNKYAVDMMASLHFSASHCQGGGTHVVRSYKETLRNDLNHRNIAKYMLAYKDRDCIPASTLRNSLRTVKVLLAASNGSSSPNFTVFLSSIDRVTPANDLYQILDPLKNNSVATWVGKSIARRGHLVTEEKPESMYQVISLFLDGIGYMTSL